MSESALNMTEAARRLGKSRVTVRRLVRDGVLPSMADAVDRRQRLIPVSAIRSLELAVQPKSLRFRSDGAGDSDSVRSDEIDAYLEAHWRPQ
jgi:excisionase family DNA binding protein